MQGRHAPEVKNRRGGGGLLSSLCGGGNGEGQSSCLLLMVAVGLILNVIVCTMLLTGTFGPAAASAATSSSTDSGVEVRNLNVNSAVESQLRVDLKTWRDSHEKVTGQFEALKAQYTELSTADREVRKMLAECQASVSSAAPASSGSSAEDAARIASLEAKLASLRTELSEAQAKARSNASPSGACPPCAASGVDHSRLLKDDLTAAPFDLKEHEIEWQCNPAAAASSNETLEYCPESATNEQYYQLQFFDRPGAGSRAAIRKPKPQPPKCVQLPPPDYRFPAKVQSMPLALGEQAVHWPNLRVQKLEDLLVFNMGTPKNLYHFNASFYDYEQEAILDASAKIIPWGHKVRLMLDVGSGGASLGMLAKRRYDVQVVSTVFADWPYCEYITERGQVCMYVDAMEAMPFAKFSYDVVHSSWVFHALFSHQLRAAYLEQNRILRPGGYMWIYGGWSFEQVDTMTHLLVDQLGYKVLYEKRNVVDTNKVKHAFDTIPFQLEWTAILLKPVRADESKCQRVPAPKK